ncbi:hypothetical protein [Rhizobium multihospitium]|uniref:hypothetical protein n=1 Tax=Rhizobium multihospitium TaxID=410764 RepID=UPI00142D6167|nr:hypothetical protein [Rhizobium multihospitium]
MMISMIIMRFIMSGNSTLRKQVGRNSGGVGATGFHGNPLGNLPAPKQSQTHACLRPILCMESDDYGNWQVRSAKFLGEDVRHAVVHVAR